MLVVCIYMKEKNKVIKIPLSFTTLKVKEISKNQKDSGYRVWHDSKTKKSL